MRRILVAVLLATLAVAARAEGLAPPPAPVDAADQKNRQPREAEKPPLLAPRLRARTRAAEKRRRPEAVRLVAKDATAPDRAPAAPVEPSGGCQTIACPKYVVLGVGF